MPGDGMASLEAAAQMAAAAALAEDAAAYAPMQVDGTYLELI